MNESGSPRQRQQYHYFYGSTEGTSDHHVTQSSSSTIRDVGSPGRTDQDSLVGEALVFSDDDREDDTPKVSESDLQQLLVSDGSGLHSFQAAGGKQDGVPSKSLRNWLSLKFLEESHTFVCIFLLGLVATLFFVATVFLNPSYETILRMPFPRVDRALFNDPASGFINKDLFHRSLLYRGGDPSREFMFPFPTGAFWTNLVLEPTADRGLSFPVVVYPYAYKWSDNLLQVSYPARHRMEDSKSIHDYFYPDLTFGAGEVSRNRFVTSFDPLSVTVKFVSRHGGTWESYLVQGSPYITIKYDNISPVIRALSIFKHAFCPDKDDYKPRDLNRRKLKYSYGVCYNDTSSQTTTLTGVQFILQTLEGINWIVFASEPISLVFDNVRKTTVTSPKRFTGVLRIALIPPPTTATPEEGITGIWPSTGLQRLIYHAGIYPISGDVSWSFQSTGVLPSSGRIGTLTFKFNTATFSAPSSVTGPKQLLMLALPHHADSLPYGIQFSKSDFDLVYRCVKGPMQPVFGSTWSYEESLPALGFDGTGFKSGRSYIDLTSRSRIIYSLKQDLNIGLPTFTDSIYEFGKKIARLSQLVHIARILKSNRVTIPSSNVTKHNMKLESDDKELAKLLQQSQRVLAQSLENFLSNNMSDALVYDQNLGGLVTTNGLSNPERADFGNGRYSSHHFHYGYILYASSVLGDLDPDFVKRFGQHIDAIYYDVAYNSNSNSKPAVGNFFPTARHKEWFDGHSFDSGLFSSIDGKSQGSSSEAVNCYYGAYLWSLVRHGAVDNPSSDTSAQTDFARLLLATEIRGARTYWHMEPPRNNSNRTAVPEAAFSPQFSNNYMVGSLGMLDAVSSTSLGSGSIYVHMMNFMPVTSITGALFSKEYVREEYSHVLRNFSDVEMAWRGFVVCNHAIINPRLAWEEAQELLSADLDPGLSKTQVLYWVSTRPEFHLNATASKLRTPHRP